MTTETSPNSEILGGQQLVITLEFAELVFDEVATLDFDELRHEEQANQLKFNLPLYAFCNDMVAIRYKLAGEQAAIQFRSGTLLAHRLVRRAAELQGASMPVVDTDKIRKLEQGARKLNSRDIDIQKSDVVLPYSEGIQWAYERLTKKESQNAYIIVAGFFKDFLKQPNLRVSRKQVYSL